MSSPETQIHSQCSFTFILFIHSWKNKHSGLWQGRLLTEGGMQAEGWYYYETQLVCSLSFSLPLSWVSEQMRVWVIEFCHLSDQWWTHLCSPASAAGSICAERRCTAMLDPLERAGQTGIYVHRNQINCKELVKRTSDGRGDNIPKKIMCMWCNDQIKLVTLQKICLYFLALNLTNTW